MSLLNELEKLFIPYPPIELARSSKDRLERLVSLINAIERWFIPDSPI